MGVHNTQKGFEMAKVKSKSFTDGDFVIQAQPAPEIGASSPIIPTIDGFVFESKPIPKRGGKKGEVKYPIASLQSGTEQSFFVPAAAGKLKNVTSSIRTFAYRNDFKVVLRTENDDKGAVTGVRVWRKA
jgi:hypothetical protein